MKEFGGPGLSSMATAVLCYELARADASFGTFVLVHNAIGMTVVDKLGDEE